MKHENTVLSSSLILTPLLSCPSIFPPFLSFSLLSSFLILTPFASLPLLSSPTVSSSLLLLSSPWPFSQLSYSFRLIPSYHILHSSIPSLYLFPLYITCMQLNVRTFSTDSEFRDPALSFILRDVICSFCSTCRYSILKNIPIVL